MPTGFKSYSPKGEAQRLVNTIVNYWAVRGHVLSIGKGKDIWIEPCSVPNSELKAELGKGEFHWIIRSTMLNGQPR